MRRPSLLWLLLLCLLFLGLGGLYGAAAMLADPSGNSMDMDAILPLLPVPNYILPGIFLLFVMGLSPLVLSYALLASPEWTWLGC